MKKDGAALKEIVQTIEPSPKIKFFMGLITLCLTINIGLLIYTFLNSDNLNKVIAMFCTNLVACFIAFIGYKTGEESTNLALKAREEEHERAKKELEADRKTRYADATNIRGERIFCLDDFGRDVSESEVRLGDGLGNVHRPDYLRCTCSRCVSVGRESRTGT